MFNNHCFSNKFLNFLNITDIFNFIELFSNNFRVGHSYICSGVIFCFWIESFFFINHNSLNVIFFLTFENEKVLRKKTHLLNSLYEKGFWRKKLLNIHDFIILFFSHNRRTGWGIKLQGKTPFWYFHFKVLLYIIVCRVMIPQLYNFPLTNIDLKPIFNLENIGFFIHTYIK